MSAPVLVVGAPRSGTTWVAEMLARGGNAAYLEEPDNHFRFAFAFRAKRTLGRRAYPLLAPGAPESGSAEYERLWRHAFEAGAARNAVSRARRSLANRLVRTGDARSVSAALAGERATRALGVAATLAVPERAVADGRPLVVKSVYAPLAVEWIASYHPVEVVVVQRNPLNVLASWIALGWLGADAPDPLATLDPAAAATLAQRFDVPPAPAAGVLGRAAWLIGALMCALDDAARRAPSWRLAVHEDVCADPHGSFAALARSVGLAWSEEGDRLLDAANRPGEGYETARVAADQRDAWRRRLDDAQVEETARVLERFPLPDAW